MIYKTAFILTLAILMTFTGASHAVETEWFQGKYYSGSGDVEYLSLLDVARRMFAPDAQYQNLSMLYTPTWNGLVEGPTWGAWWIQNSYGTTWCALPFLEEPWTTFLENSHDLWFSQMGDGVRKGANDWVGPDGCLCDCASPGWIMYKQGDGKTGIHDWGMEFTAAGLLMQSELLLISRDQSKINHYLPMLERCAGFIETRRDQSKNLFLAGPAGNLLAPSYAGWKKEDGTYGHAYLAGLSVTYIAALDRLIELEKLAQRPGAADAYQRNRDSARQGLETLFTGEGYLIRSLDPDGARHGVYGAEKHGYFEASPNHDAIAFRVADEARAKTIFSKIESLPELRPHHFILPNYPSYDDMYEKLEGIWQYGTWVNGGHWSTCEARMIMAYSILGKFEDSRRSMKHLMTFADRFRMDNPLTKCGSDVYQPKEPINLCYDTLGPSAAFVRGLFEYIYKADRLVIIPHIPEGIHSLEQRFPIRFGSKTIRLSTTGNGAISKVTINNRPCESFIDTALELPYESLPQAASVHITLGEAASGAITPPRTQTVDRYSLLAYPPDGCTQTLRLNQFLKLMRKEGFGETYEAAHARIAFEAYAAVYKRKSMIQSGEIQQLPEPSASAATKVYEDTAAKLWSGLEKALLANISSPDSGKARIAEIWRTTRQ